MRVAPGSYLILARPRSRTGWLSALLFGDVPCYHDELHRLSDLVEARSPFGMSAPSMPMMDLDYVAEIYREAPIVVIDRPIEESFLALERFVGATLPEGSRERYETLFQALLDRLPRSKMLSIPCGELELYETVDRVHRHCLGRGLCREKFRAFNLLRIEQHLPKVISNTPVTLFRR